MTWFSGFVVYVILWWLVFFTTLPFGIKAPEEVGQAVVPGTVPSAPVRPRLWLKAGIATLVSAVLWGCAYAIIASGAISFRAPPAA